MVLKDLKRQYERALRDINDRIKLLQSDEMTQSRIYQVGYQKRLKAQIEAILDKLHADEYNSIEKYLNDGYTDAFIGSMYDMQGQGIPIITPIDRNAAAKAIVTDSKLSTDLYASLGYDMGELKKHIRQEITRGIATSLPYEQIARNISNFSTLPLSNAKRIVRTEGHRIQQASADDARNTAKSKGADVVKQWDASLDGATRPLHRQLDGQIRETDEPFEAGGRKVMYPGKFGTPDQDCNCRCVALTRARWALDEKELETLKERAKFFGLDKTKDFEDYKKKYLKAAKTVEKTGKSGILKAIEVPRGLGAASRKYPVKLPDSRQHTKLLEGQTVTGKTFAGKGTDTAIRERFRLESDYKIPESEWEKVSGVGYIVLNGKKRKAELHWYQAQDEIFEMKVKRYIDED